MKECGHFSTNKFLTATTLLNFQTLVQLF